MLASMKLKPLRKSSEPTGLEVLILKGNTLGSHNNGQI